MNTKREYYFDNAATTIPFGEVIDSLTQTMKTNFGNSSSIHRKGVNASLILESAREKILESLNTKKHHVYFTSSGTEANNWVINNFIDYKNKIKIITSRFEHKSILAPLAHFEQLGLCEIILVNILPNGLIDLADLKSKLAHDISFATFMSVNNEIGTIQPIEEIFSLCKQYKIPLHIDACQSFLRLSHHLETVPFDFMTINAHKIHGPKGIAALIVHENHIKKLQPFILGGGHESGLRSGTVNTYAVAGFKTAVELILQNSEFNKKTAELKKYFIEQFSNKVQSGKINFDEHLISHILNFRIPRKNAKKVFFALNKLGFYLSTSSACNSNETTPSHVLKACHMSDESNLESLRISFSINNTFEEIDLLINQLQEIEKSQYE